MAKTQVGSLPLFVPESTWTPPKAPPRLDNVTLLAVDCETRDPNLTVRGPGFLRRDAQNAGVALSTTTQSWYFPYAHPEDNCSWDVKAWLADELSVDRTYVFCNCHYDIEALNSDGIHPAGTWTDIQILQALINEEFAPGYGLEAISQYWLGTGKRMDELNQALAAYSYEEGQIGYLPGRFVGNYAEVDALRTIQAYVAQKPSIRADGLEDVLDLEQNLLPLTWQMRLNGVRFDRNRAFELRELWTGEIRKLTDSITKSAGISVDPWSPKSLTTFCAREGIRVPRTAKGNPSFVGDFLETHSSPVLQTVAKIRKLDKMVGDFIDKWLYYSETDGRIHPQWMLTHSEEGGTRSGRMASKNPSLQQVPVRDPYFGPLMRSLFLPNEGEVWIKLDINSQEIRIAVHYAYKCDCRGSDQIVAQYRANPHLDFHQMVADMALVERTPAKTISLGVLYGMGIARMMAQLGFDSQHSGEVLNRYFLAAPYFKELAEIATETAAERGYVKTILGRRRRFTDSRFMHKALNAIVQGSAGDEIKQAMWNIWNELQMVPLLTVHDELGFSGPAEVARQLADLIETAIEFVIPIIVDPVCLPNWNSE